ncbi:MAG: hypothetical protein JSS02_27965 [Planctomycetes bacterium]|nr:hypothetical protein [Planctomycetota bacterium]
MSDNGKTPHDGMNGDSRYIRKLQGPRRGKETDDECGEGSCSAFGYLRGIRERADAIEIRFQDGNSTWFPYAWLGEWKFNPSNGLLLKFSGDLVYLVLIRGSNLDRPLSDTTTNLTTSGLQRHRIVWLREMSAEEIRQVGESGPTIDRIEIAEFESNTELKTWLEANAPAFVH